MKTKTKEPSILCLLKKNCVMSSQRRHRRARIVALIILGSIIASSLVIGGYSQYVVNAMESPLNGQILPIRATTTPIKELSVKEYVRQEIEKAGLKWEEVDCLVRNESGWNVWKQGVNTNMTTDSGLFQINSIHKGTISLKDRFDVEKSTKWFIEKRLRDGNYNAWVGFRKCR